MSNKTKKIISILALVLALCMAFAACTPATETEKEPEDKPAQGDATPAPDNGDEPVDEPPVVEEDPAQGVTDTSIKVGNTAATSGAFAVVGVPFNDAIKAVFKQVNDAGGIGGRMIEFVTYDDGFDAATGASLTEKLVEEDEVFALVGHFGTPTVSSTVDYIQEIGVPMVYAATGINALYFENAPGNPVLAIQPIYLTDGRIMAARAFHESLYGGQKLPADAKVGVLYTNDDAGVSILAGVEAEAAVEGRALIKEAVADGTYATAVQKMKDEGVAVVILAMNQAPFKETLVAMNDAQLEVPVFTSYVNADVTAVDHTKYSENRPIYTNAWVDVFSEKGQADTQGFVACIAAADLTDDVKNSYYTNSYAIAGYIAATVFVDGLKRCDEAGVVLTWENFIAQMENGPFSIPMGGTVDFSDGKRWGIDSMSLLQYTFTIPEDGTEAVEAFAKILEIETLTEIEGK